MQSKNELAKGGNGMMKKWLSSGEQIHIPNDEDADLLMWIELIVTKGIPLESVRDETMRKYLGKKAYAVETVRDVLLATQFLVEKAIAAEMKEAGVGAIVHDGWTKYSAHFVCVLGSYMRKDMHCLRMPKPSAKQRS